MKNNKKNYSNAQLNRIATGLNNYFGQLWDFIEAENSPSLEIKNGKVKKKKRQWRTVTDFKLDDVTLVKRFTDPDKLVGVRFKTAHGETKYVMTDIDITSQYHPENDPNGLDKILETCEQMGLVQAVYVESSDNGGMHLYFALSRPMPVFDAACWLETAMLTAGLEVKAGQLELFPNAKQYRENGKWSLYNAHNLPLQPNSGSRLMDSDLEVTSDNIEDFLAEMNFAAKYKNEVTDEMMLEARIAREAVTKQRLLTGGFGKFKSKKVVEWQEDLEFYQLIGWTGRGETNDLLIKFGCYGVVFEGLEGEELEAYILKTAINAEGYAEHCGHQHEIEKRCREVAKLTSKYYWKLGTEAKRSIIYTTMQGKKVVANGNQAKTLNTTERLQAVIDHLTETLTSFEEGATEFVNLIIKTSKKKFKVGFSTKTLFNVDKYEPLWKPLFMSLAIAATPAPAIAEAMPEVEAEPTPIVPTITSPEIAPREPEKPAEDDFTQETEKAPKTAENRHFPPFEKSDNGKWLEPAETLATSHLLYEVLGGEPDLSFPRSQNLKKEQQQQTSEPELELSDFRNISNSDGQEFPATAESDDKKNLSVSPPIVPPVEPLSHPYVSKVPKSELPKSDIPPIDPLLEARKDPEYQTKRGDMFAAVRGILDKAKAKVKPSKLIANGEFIQYTEQPTEQDGKPRSDPSQAQRFNKPK